MSGNQSPPYASSTALEDDWLVACLCAEWCGTCREFRAAFEELAAKHGDKRFRWIDVEDEAELAEDYEVENFPTLLIQRGRDVLFYGTVLPNANIIDRQLSALSTSPAQAVDVPDLLSKLGQT